MTEAVQIIREHPEVTRADPPVQEAVTHRIAGYPGKITENLHRAHAYVPVSVAALLSELPTLVSASVQAFCNCYPADQKTCQMMRFFPPETRVMTSVTLTKCHYAQLIQQKFTPDKRTGWNLPLPTDPRFKSHDLGIKLACGFEILVNGAQSSGGLAKEKSEELNQSIEQLKDDPRWTKYVHSLGEKGYFKGELEGSRLYQELLEKARQYYTTTVLPSSVVGTAIGCLIKSIVDKLEVNIDEFRRKEGKLPPADDDSWLAVGPEELDAMLEEKFGSSTAGLEDIPESLSTFVEHVSSFEGAEAPSKEEGIRKASSISFRNDKLRKMSKERKMSTQSRKISTVSNTSDSSCMSSFSNKVTLEVDSFTDALHNILDLGVPDDDWHDDDSTSGMSSYSDEEDPETLAYMQQMDRELANTTLAESFVKANGKTSQKDEDSFDDVEDFRPVDVDLNALKNLLECYSSQHGLPGPASTILGSMGIRPPAPQ